MKQFNAKVVTDNCISWIRNWFNKESGNAKGLILGISGGKDSTVVAKLCADAIGKDMVFGVIMPNGSQKDIDDAINVCNIIGINYKIINIKDIYKSFLDTINTTADGFSISDHTYTNIPPRIRMTILYTIGQEIGYRIVGTGNLSEHTVGYFTKWGDGACDMNPIINLTMEEVVSIGDYLGLPYDLVHKTPSDGLCGKTDEDNFGFTYQDISLYVYYGTTFKDDVDEKINKLRKRNRHKDKPIPSFPYERY